jgi:hypothetical protein
MSNSIFEEDKKEGAASAGGMATAQQMIEKKARELAYNIRYDVKQEIGDKKVAPAIMKQLLLKRWQKSSSASNIKLSARRMLFGEDYIGNVSDFASDSLANALFKVFVEGVHIEEKIELNYLRELDENPDRKYKVRVTDKKTGNSYVRYATREKITDLRSNPNIQSVEMTEYGEPREGERQRGDQTAAAKAGQDYDGDGKVESGAKEHRGVVHNAIQRKKGGVPDGKDTSSVREEFLTDAATEGPSDKKITGKGVNNYSGKNPAVTVMPTDGTEGNTKRKDVYAHYEPTGEVIAETGYSRFLNMIQEKKMTKAEKKKETELKSKYDPSEMKASMENQYGPEKGKNVYFATIRKQAMGEESECGCDEKSNTDKDEMRDDPRSMKTKVNLVKNKLRAMGLKMSYEPEGEVIDEARASEKRGMGSPESPLSAPGRAANIQRGEQGGRHQYSGSVEDGGAQGERGRPKSDPHSQAQRLRNLVSKKPGKYAKMQRKKKGGDIGSRFD